VHLPRLPRRDWAGGTAAAAAAGGHADIRCHADVKMKEGGGGVKDSLHIYYMHACHPHSHNTTDQPPSSLPSNPSTVSAACRYSHVCPCLCLVLRIVTSLLFSAYLTLVSALCTARNFSSLDGPAVWALVMHRGMALDIWRLVSSLLFADTLFLSAPLVMSAIVVSIVGAGAGRQGIVDRAKITTSASANRGIRNSMAIFWKGRQEYHLQRGQRCHRVHR
jgi:hypothetical protein